MKYRVLQTSQYKRELKFAARRGYDIGLMRAVVAALADGIPSLPNSATTPSSASSQDSVNAT